MRLISSAFIFLAAAQICQASLGEKISSIELDRKVMRTQPVEVSSGQDAKFKVHKLTSETVQVREYVAPDGTVFAVTWRGVAQPNLSNLLGKYSSEYQGALAETKKNHGRRSKRMKLPHLVVEKSGHMRDVRGKAYVPSLLPPGVRPEDIG